MRVNPVIYGILLIVVFFGIILVFQAGGVWSISGKVNAQGQAIQPDASDPDTLKGWMTLDQVMAAYQVSLEELITRFNLPAGTAPSTAIKDLESDTFDPTALKAWLLERNTPGAAPLNGQETTLELPASNPAVKPTLEAQPTTLDNEHTAPEKFVGGKTTFQDLLDWGLPEETLQQILGDDIPAPTTIIKNFVTEKGLEFSTIKGLLQVELDKLTP